eukprot:7885673-Karenia_brevis.AAC.1
MGSSIKCDRGNVRGKGGLHGDCTDRWVRLLSSAWRARKSHNAAAGDTNSRGRHGVSFLLSDSRPFKHRGARKDEHVERERHDRLLHVGEQCALEAVSTKQGKGRPAVAVPVGCSAGEVSENLRHLTPASATPHTVFFTTWRGFGRPSQGTKAAAR